MIRFALISAIAACCCCAAAISDEKSQISLFPVGDDKPAPNSKRSRPEPVTLSARPLKPTDSQQSFEIHLKIDDEFEIYSQRKAKFTLPLKVELLDENLKPVKSEFKYPKPKRIPMKELLGSDCFVYSGNPQITAKCDAEHEIKYVRLFSHGYSKRGY